MFKWSRRLVLAVFVVLGLAGNAGAPAFAGDAHDQRDGPAAESEAVTSGLVLPMANPVRGRALFASKGCVACHSINGVGGHDAPALDVSTFPRMMNPFSFAARMWRGAETMILLQQDLLGQQIELTGQELFDIIAFAHSEKEQKLFSEADVPHDVLELIEHTHGGDEEHQHEDHQGDHAHPAAGGARLILQPLGVDES